jgi:hypothetical protein
MRPRSTLFSFRRRSTLFSFTLCWSLGCSIPQAARSALRWISLRWGGILLRSLCLLRLLRLQQRSDRCSELHHIYHIPYIPRTSIQYSHELVRSLWSERRPGPKGNGPKGNRPISLGDLDQSKRDRSSCAEALKSCAESSW